MAVDAFAGDAVCGGLAGSDELLWLWSVDGLFGALPAVFDFVGCLGCFFGFGEVDEVAVEPLGVTLGALFSGPGESVGVVGAGVFDPCAEYVVEVVGYFGGSFVVDVGGFAFAADSSVGAVGEGDLAAEGGVEVVADPVGEFVESGCGLLDFCSGEVQVVAHSSPPAALKLLMVTVTYAPSRHPSTWIVWVVPVMSLTTSVLITRGCCRRAIRLSASWPRLSSSAT